MLRRLAKQPVSRLLSLHRPHTAFRNASNDMIDITQGLEYLGEAGEEIIEMAQAADDFGKAELSPFREAWDRDGTPVSDELLQKCADMGFGGLYASYEAGGGEMSRLATSVIVEALSSHCVSTTSLLTIHNMVNWMIDTFGNADQKERFCQKMSTFELFGSYCLTEPGAGSDAASLQTKAVLSDCGKYYSVSGEKAFISNAGRSDVYIVMCRTGGAGPKGISALILEKGMDGLSFGALERKVGWNSQPTRAVIMDEVKVPVENRIGEEGQGFNFAMAGLNGGRINIASCSLGAGHACINAARDHAVVRKQFGKDIAQFQNTQFKLAEMTGQLISSRQVVRSAAMHLDNKSPVAAQMCALAKMEATEKCFELSDTALQMHGGYGYLKDYPVQQYWRDCRVHRILEGTNEVMRMLVSRNVIQNAST